MDIATAELTEYLTGGPEFISVPSLTAPVSAKSILAINDNRVQRLTFEARVLAYRDITVAAEKTGLAIDLAHGFCDIFFDVHDRLDGRRAIAGTVIHTPGKKSDNLRSELYRQAYFVGPFVAEHWIHHLPFLETGCEHDLSSRAGMEREQLELSVAWTGTSDAFYELKLQSVYGRLLEQQSIARSYVDTVFDHVVAVLADRTEYPQQLTTDVVSDSALDDVTYPTNERHAA